MTCGLWVFLATVAINVVGLLLDLALDRSGRTTITDLVRMIPAVGLPIIAMQIAGLVGLLHHFYGDH